MIVAKISYSHLELRVFLDDEDAHLLEEFTWRGYPNRNTFYACTSVNKTTLYLHRMVLGAPNGVRVDHINGNGLDCQRGNLRTASQAQNARNSRHNVGVSGYRGVRKRPIGYQAQIKVHGITRTIGTYPTAIEAAVARDAVALELHGEFAVLNFPEVLKTSKNGY